MASGAAGLTMRDQIAAPTAHVETLVAHVLIAVLAGAPILWKGQEMTLPGLADARLPVLAAQREVWLAQQMSPDSTDYQLGDYLEIDGPIDPVAFEAALRQAVAEAGCLHARFVEDAGVVWQIAEPASDWAFPVLDISGEADPPAAAEAWMRADLARPMDLERGPLFSSALLRLGPRRFFWYQSSHHIVMDGFSAALMTARIAELYTAALAGLAAGPSRVGSWRQLQELDAQYRASEAFAADRSFWSERFADLPEPARLAGQPARAPRKVLRHTAILPPSGARRPARRGAPPPGRGHGAPQASPRAAPPLQRYAAAHAAPEAAYQPLT